MKTLKNPILLILILCYVSAVWSCRNHTHEQNIYIDNGKIRLGFDRETGYLADFKDIVNSHDYLDKRIINSPPWDIELFHVPDSSMVNLSATSLFSYSKPDERTLILTWKEFQDINNKDFQVTARITLEDNRPMSSWKVSIEGMDGELIHKVVFPKIAGINDPGDEILAVPFWMGQKLLNPRSHLSAMEDREKKYEWDYPGQLSMQCLTLYNEEKCCMYAACNDTLAFRKSFTISMDTLNYLTFRMNNYPVFDPSLTRYSPAYEAIIGSFKGDWVTGAELYRDWASGRKWCRNSRLTNHTNPTWLDSTALWVWNRGRSENVLIPAIDLKQRLNLPVNVFWHWWHGCAYDVGFPEYFPPREGRNPFRSAVSSAQEHGVRSIVYMNVLQWGTSTESWKKENASLYAVKDINGNLRSHVYNIFTGKSLTNMCIATQFWKDKYASLCDSAVNFYHLNGIYMDQACLTRMCYDPKHEHSPGGGNYWIDNFARLASQIRSKIPPGNPPVLAGEGGGEAWLPHLNAFLTLQVSKERYAGPGGWETIPFYQVVYHQYGISYGNYSSLLTPPYDELWPEEFAPERQLDLLDEKFNRQFLMEQARSFVWGMQPTIANYRPLLASERKEEIDYLINLARVRYKGLKYLLYGKFLRSPQMDIPEAEFEISKLSIYVGRGQDNVTTFRGKYPLIYTGTWQADDHSIGIALASISDDQYPVDFNFKADDYGISSSGKIFLIDVDGKKLLNSYSEGNIDVKFTLLPKETCIVEIVPDK